MLKIDKNEEFLKSVNSTNLFPYGPVSFVILGAWDTRRGPLLKNLWYVQNSKTDSQEKSVELNIQEIENNKYCIDYVEPTKFIVNYILGALLNGGDEPCHCDDSYTTSYANQKQDKIDADNSIKFKFILSEKHKMIVHSFLFNAPVQEEKSITPFCLSFIFSMKLKDKCLVWQPMISNFMNQNIPYLRIIHRKSDQDGLMTNYTVVITYLIGVLRSLDQFSVSNTICLKKTFFSTSSNEKIRREFLCTAIMSHLITFGRSLVIGTDVNLINTMIRTLAIFLPLDKRELCVELIEKEHFNFSSDIMIQGLCKDNILDVDYTFWSVVSGSYPLTVINLNTMRVLQSGNYTYHKWMQYLMHEALLKKLFLSEKCQPIKLYLKNININLDYILKDGCYLGDLCKTFVTKIMNASGCRRKLEIFNIFMELMNAKAKLLVTLAKQLIRKDSNRKNWKFLRNQIQEICQLKCDGDFLVVLAFAEQLCPGIYCTVLECPSEKINDLSTMFNYL